MGFFRSFRNRYLPTEEDSEVRWLHKELEILEANEWATKLLWEIATRENYEWDEETNDWHLPLYHLETFAQLTEDQKEYAFIMLIGALESAIEIET